MGISEKNHDALELVFVFNKDYWKQDYARESCAVFIHGAFSRSFERIYAECSPENQSSWRLLERLGFSQESHLIKNTWYSKDEQGKPILKDTYIYSIYKGNLSY